MKRFKFILLAAITTFAASAQQEIEGEIVTTSLLPDSAATAIQEPVVSPMSPYYFLPAIFKSYKMELSNPDFSFNPDKKAPDEASMWIDQEIDRATRLDAMVQRYMLDNPGAVRYNVAWLPDPPKVYHAVLDPSTHLLTVEEVNIDKTEATAEGLVDNIKRRNWIHSFDGLLQFSQAYLSQNWYQGGNNNLNMLLNLAYNVKLNPAYHPKLMFETSIIYKLAVNSTPDDSIHKYNISEDLLQINSKFGFKAAKRWFYSIALQFKTQIFNGYDINSPVLRSTFMSPGELNVGVGMTYNYESPNKKFKFDASISPFSYNLKTCLDGRMDPTIFGIDAGMKTKSQYGSSAEAKAVWTIARNITYTGRLFVFTDYKYLQGDFENTFSFTINKFLSTQLYVHLRYDSQQPRVADCKWDNWQMKEILSFGFAYKFSMI